MAEISHERKIIHTLAAQLRWAISSAPLLHRPQGYSACEFPISKDYEKLFFQDCEFIEKIESKTWISELGNTPSQLVGKRFEQLIFFWFNHHPNFTVHLFNHQLHQAGTTLGEIDLVVEELHTGKRFHIEMACKLFLSTANSREWHSWVGPNGRDTLKQKMDTFHRQLTIDNQLTRNLPGFSDSNPIPWCWLKGYLFHHYLTLKIARRPTASSPDYEMGWWIRQSEAKHFFQSNRQWAILDRTNWIGPYSTRDSKQVLCEEELLQRVSTQLNDRSPHMLVAEMSSNQEAWHEESRGFVMLDWGPFK